MTRKWHKKCQKKNKGGGKTAAQRAWKEKERTEEYTENKEG